MIGVWLFVSIPVLMAGCGGPLPIRRINALHYGSVEVIKPRGRARALIILFSGRSGLIKADDAAAQTLARNGAFVAEVDTAAYLQELNKSNPKCHNVVYDADGLSRLIQREYHFPNYLTPILAGVGEGGTVAEMTLAAALPATFAGAVSIDPAPLIATMQPFCTSVAVRPVPGGFGYGPAQKLNGFWTVGLMPDVASAGHAYLTSLQEAGMPVEVSTLAANSSLGDTLLSMIEPHIGGVAALPLTILPVAKPSKLMAVVISGDGGWRDLDRSIAENLQQHGVPVVGWDSLRYFWTAKTPDETTDQLADVLTTYMAKWNTPDVALIGYSFGADVMPFAYNGLPHELRSHVKLIALLGLAHRADFRIVVYGWLGAPPSSDALSVLPELSKIPASMLQCYYGQDEEDTLCPAEGARGAEVIRTAGGHHFDGNYDALAEDILAGFKARVAARSQNHASLARPAG
jgi:type IV secretory pathway VirJ component